MTILFFHADGIPKRLNVAIMLFMACFISYMLRVNMSVNILAMVNAVASNSSAEVDDVSN
jgi:ACS family sodium-dependent inorganic phosphate cotransporter